MQVALWAVADGQPARLEPRREFLEVDLESWIECHPDLVMEGMRWVGRQVILPDRSRLDLVGVSLEGAFVIAEPKRGRLGIGALTQAMHYLLTISAMEPDTLLRRLDLDDDTRDTLATALSEEGELDVVLLLVGTGRAPELERATSFLSDRGLDVTVRVVSFSSFVDETGRVFLAREVDEPEQTSEELSPRQRGRRAASVERIQDRARDFGVGPSIEAAIDLAQQLGLRVKPWPKSITIVPPFTHGRTLIYLSPKPDGRVGFGYSSDNLESIYDADADQVTHALGANWEDLRPDEFGERLQGFRDLMDHLLSATGGADTREA
jgi:hypothetical protein